MLVLLINQNIKSNPDCSFARKGLESMDPFRREFHYFYSMFLFTSCILCFAHMFPAKYVIQSEFRYLVIGNFFFQSPAFFEMLQIFIFNFWMIDRLSAKTSSHCREKRLTVFFKFFQTHSLPYLRFLHILFWRIKLYS